MKTKCDNCGRRFKAEAELRSVYPDIPDLLARLDPGGIVPHGECPQCGALVYAEAGPDDLICSVWGDRVAVAELRDHLCSHNPNAESLDWEEVRNQFELSSEEPAPLPAPKRKVVVVVRGGVAEVALCPEDVVVEVRDYDTEGSDPVHLSHDGASVSLVEGPLLDWIDEFATGAAQELTDEGMSAADAASIANEAATIIRKHEANRKTRRR